MSAFEVTQAVLAAAVIVGALVAVKTANVPRERRHQQFALPIVALIYATAAAVVLYLFNDWFDRILGWIFHLVPFLEGLYQTRWLYTIENVIIIAAFLVIKFAYRNLAKLLFSGERFIGSGIVEQVYDYDVASGRWNVKTRLSHLRQFLGAMFIASLIVTGLLVIAMNLLPAAPAFAAIAFPSLAVLVLGEVFYALRGCTRDEAADSMVGEGDASTRVVNYAALRDVYRQRFASRVIQDDVDLSNPNSLSTHQALTELQQSEAHIEQLFGSYFDHAKINGLQIDENLVHASLSMLRGTSTLISTPFYPDLTEYLALPTYIRLLNGGKCLIVMGRDSASDDVTSWFEGALEGITGVPDLWSVGPLLAGHSYDLDVGVLSLADVHNHALLAEYDDFFREVETVLLVEPSRLLATGQLGMSVVVSRLARGETPVYVAIDRNHDGLVDALSHLLKVNLTNVVATSQVLGASSEMVWNADGPHLAAQIMPGVARYLGVGTEIAAVAMKYQVSQVEWVGGDKFPVTDMSWIAGQYYGKINAFAEIDLSQRSLETALHARSNPLSLERTQHRFLIIEDELSNVYESIRLFATRSTESGFINLISEDYLLRDYMVGNHDLFSSDAKAIPSIVPDYARTRRNTVLRLLVMLSAFDVEESVLLRELELVGCIPVEHEDIEAEYLEAPVILLLKDLIDTYLGVRETLIKPMIPRGGLRGEHDEMRYRLVAGTALDGVIAQMGPAYYLVEDEAEGRDFIGSCMHNHVQQTVLPGQFLTVAGKYYEVQQIEAAGRREEVVLRRAAEHITGRPVYRQLRTFTLGSQRIADSSAPREAGAEVIVERIVVSLSVQTHGYLDLPQRSQLAEARVVSVPLLAPRNYVEKEALRLSMPGASPEVRRTIALLLNEMFVTVFPSGHPFITAVTEDQERSFGNLLPELSGTEADDEAIYILEDSLVDLGLTVAVERHWRRLLETITDYLEWVEQPHETESVSREVPLIFPGETEEDIAERERRVAEVESRGGYDAMPKPSFWRRVWTRILSVLKRPQAKRPGSPDETDEQIESAEVVPTTQESSSVHDRGVDVAPDTEFSGEFTSDPSGTSWAHDEPQDRPSVLDELETPRQPYILDDPAVDILPDSSPTVSAGLATDLQAESDLLKEIEKDPDPSPDLPNEGQQHLLEPGQDFEPSSYAESGESSEPLAGLETHSAVVPEAESSQGAESDLPSSSPKDSPIEGVETDEK